MNSSPSRRIRLLWIVIAFVTLGFVARLYWLQIVEGSSFSEEAGHQYASASGNVFDRGTIYFSSKDGGLIAAASLESGFLLAINPSKIADPEEAYETLSPLLPLDHDDFVARASKSGDRYEEIAHRLSEEAVAALSALDAPWTIVTREKWRFYPGKRLASNALGFVGYQGDDFSGRYGLERYYNDTLSRDRTNLYENFFSEIFSTVREAATTGLKGDIVSTIEPNVQASLEHMLSSVQEKWNPDTVGAVVINPKNGDIYALAVLPNFNL